MSLGEERLPGLADISRLPKLSTSDRFQLLGSSVVQNVFERNLLHYHFIFKNSF